MDALRGEWVGRLGSGLGDGWDGWLMGKMVG